MFFLKACVVTTALLVNTVCCKIGNAGLNAVKYISSTHDFLSTCVIFRHNK